MKKPEREVITRSDFHKRVWCECGYNYNPAHDDATFGPKHCPECGNYRGNLPNTWDLEGRGWESEVVQRVRTGIPKSPNPFESMLEAVFGYNPGHVDKRSHFEDRDGNRINP